MPTNNKKLDKLDRLYKQHEAPSFDEVFKDDEVDEVSDKNAPLSSEKGAKIDIKRDNVIISKVSNNNNNLANKRKKEYIPLTPDNIDDFALTPEEIEGFDDSWLIDDFIVNQSLGMIYAEAGSGKSYFSIFLALYMLKNNIAKKVYYLDADNGNQVVKKRKIDKIIRFSDNKIKYLHSKKLNPFKKDRLLSDFVKPLEQKPSDFYNDTFFIFDSARNFISGDLSADYKVKPFLDDLQTLRDYGANVIFLHHQPKQPLNKDENNGLYKGATAFNDSADYSYLLSSKKLSDDKMLILLKAIKSRNLEKNQAFILDTMTFNLEFVDYDDYSLSDKELDTIEVIQEILNENKAGISKRELIKKVLERAKFNEMEILGSNALRDFLPKLKNKFLTFEKTDEKRRNSSEIYRPL
ncbi:AAA family ATPase [Campylobacter ureolyticus]|uniref:AAA family ATPase n=1 Tax=Campylobacter ureolyticus TaxID=827 RepID=UPI0022B4B414|nr:AAA family ATPase [Campylobacter ureolyticus]MCZ6156860.1 AAA family ATPase [Campylobacter ureolyticus]